MFDEQTIYEISLEFYDFNFITHNCLSFLNTICNTNIVKVKKYMARNQPVRTNNANKAASSPTHNNTTISPSIIGFRIKFNSLIALSKERNGDRFDDLFLKFIEGFTS